MKSVLVIEDDLPMLQNLVEVLEDEDYDAVGASSVAEAVHRIEERSFDLIVTDVRLPKIDGIDGLVLLQKKLPKVKSIVISGYSGEDAAERAIKLDDFVEDWLAKPFTRIDFLDAVERVLNSDNWLIYYANLLKRTPVKLLNLASKFLSRDKNVSLNAMRDKAYLALYKGIKSGLLEVGSANIVFSKMARYDRDYRHHVTSNPNEDQREQLTKLYQEEFDLLAGLIQSQRRALGESEIPRDRFRHFFDTVKDAKVSLHDFKLAATLWEIPFAELSQNLELQKRRQALWGAPIQAK
ncbi:MAG: response regulator [Candidatus Eremiobacteraeota bacterium]|nr:response regulator [Candidatus Eremiobacteraeota bacterium]